MVKKKVKRYDGGGSISLGSDLDEYTRQKVEEIDQPRLDKMRQQIGRGEAPKYEEPSVADSLKKIGYGALNAYGVPLASAVSGVANAGKAAVETMRGDKDGPKLHYDKKMAKGGKVSSASSRADGIAQRGKTRGKYC